MKEFIEKERLDKRLCIDCLHHVSIGGFMGNPTHYCGKYDRSPVDDSPTVLAILARQKDPCNEEGVYWEKLENLIEARDKEEAKHLNYEEGVSEWMDHAKRHYMKEDPMISCGSLDEAIKRVRAKNNE